MQSKYRLLSRQEQTIFLIYFTNQTKIKPPLVNSSSYIHLKHEPTSKKKPAFILLKPYTNLNPSNAFKANRLKKEKPFNLQSKPSLKVIRALIDLQRNEN